MRKWLGHLAPVICGWKPQPRKKPPTPILRLDDALIPSAQPLLTSFFLCRCQNETPNSASRTHHRRRDLAADSCSVPAQVVPAQVVPARVDRAERIRGAAILPIAAGAGTRLPRGGKASAGEMGRVRVTAQGAAPVSGAGAGLDSDADKPVTGRMIDMGPMIDTRTTMKSSNSC